MVAGVALVAASCGQTSSPAAHMATSPTPLSHLVVSDSTPIIIYADPASPTQLDGMTWDGQTAGKLSEQLPSGQGNPQNNLFASASDVEDRSGAAVMKGTYGAKVFAGTWADDGRHFCQVVPFDNPGDGGIQTTLQLVTVGADTRDVAKAGMLNNQTFVSVAACSPSADRAIVVQSGGQGIGTAQVWGIQLSTGRTIWTHDYTQSPANVHVVASRDGAYVAENLTAGGSTVFGSDGKAITKLPSSIEAFSWDGSLAVVDHGYGTAPVEVISWRDGTVIWTGPSGAGLLNAQPQPDGSELAIWVLPTADFLQKLPQGGSDLFVISATGRSIAHIA